MFMPTTQEKDSKDFMGSVVCQEPTTGNHVVSFFTLTIDQEDPDRIDYPQQPMRQSHFVNYPILAYKCMTPDNRDIAIVHLA